MLQRSFIHWLPLPPHTILGARVPSISMATVGAVDGEGCLEWQPWQESRPSNDPGGKGGRQRWWGGKERARKRSMSFQSRVIMVVRFKGSCTVTSFCPPVKVSTGIRWCSQGVWIGKWLGVYFSLFKISLFVLLSIFQKMSMPDSISAAHPSSAMALDRLTMVVTNTAYCAAVLSCIIPVTGLPPPPIKHWLVKISCIVRATTPTSV